MRVPTRKPGQHTFDKKDPHVTEKKFSELKNKLQILKTKRPSLIDEVKRLALDGDFSENHAYSLAKGKLRGINQGILDIKNQLKKAIIIKNDNPYFSVELGSTVLIENKNEKKEYTILGSTETNPSVGIISHNSPIGQALMNKKINDEVSIKLKNKTVHYKIIQIK